MAALPSGVLGPEDCCAFFRLASCCLSEITILDLPFPGLGRSARPRFQDTGGLEGRAVSQRAMGREVLLLLRDGGREFIISACDRKPPGNWSGPRQAGCVGAMEAVTHAPQAVAWDWFTLRWRDQQGLPACGIASEAGG